ncbi:glycoside hydrolase family 17 protein [Piedraia hortae CBS 480.64]|uniref:glucan 1,3-beta-glucosidase n=1 Tax=Piedraia hortae CBS 480.64 TaxID=1314780 RepID=A0A6A7BTE3_9PEZI|nr:glycoside hydrolase family 17 protein [Piedraia hortae CBS 480.64]
MLFEHFAMQDFSLYGFALGTKLPDVACKTTANYAANFEALTHTIRPNTDAKVVRTYSASECNSAAEILPGVREKGVRVVVWVWPDTDSIFSADKTALSEAIKRYEGQVYGITVGSEALYRGDPTGEILAQQMREVKDLFPNIKIGTADNWNKFTDGTADAVLQAGVADVTMANAFSYWQGKDIGSAVNTYIDDVQQALARVQELMGSLDVVEPTDGGSDYGPAKAGMANAASFFKKTVCALLGWGVNPWKPLSIGDSGIVQHEKQWRAMNADRTLRTNFSPRC